MRALRLDASAQPLGSVALTPNVDAVRHPGHQPGAAVPLFHADGGFSVLWTSLGSNGQSGANGLFARRYHRERRAGRECHPAAPAGVDRGSGACRRHPPLGSDAGALARVRPGRGPRRRHFRAHLRPLLAADRRRVSGSTPIPRPSRADQRWPWTPPAASSPSGRAGSDTRRSRCPPVGRRPGRTASFFGIYAQRFTTASCALNSGQLCLNGRFRVEVRFTDPRSNLPAAGGPCR